MNVPYKNPQLPQCVIPQSHNSVNPSFRDMSSLIHITDGIIANPLFRMATPVNFCLKVGEQLAIIGANASGKSRFIDILTGRHRLIGDAIHYDFGEQSHRLLCENIRHIAFRDMYGDASADNVCYQQRWNHGDQDEEIKTVREALGATDGKEGDAASDSMLETLLPLMDEPVITLSSGELRRLQLVRALRNHPRVLILDNPFIGLDDDTRRQLSELLEMLIQQTGLTVIAVLSKTDDLPSFITHVVEVENLNVLPKKTRHDWLSTRHSHSLPLPGHSLWEKLPQREIAPFYPQQGGEILHFNHVSIRYGRRTILNNLDWTVCEGERWALSGPNGSGKSTLLSLVCADNPQGYACDIRLFGHRRGSGESIWEIKHHIGYVSPEMHRAYRKDIPALNIVASGLFDTVGLYTHPHPEQLEVCRLWMEIFGIQHLADRTFLSLSSGEQRLCLLARAFVKDPELLILDEPLHGLDDLHRAQVLQIIDTFCARPHKTLVMVTHYADEYPLCITHRLKLTKNLPQ